VSNFKSLQSTIQGSTSSFAPFNPKEKSTSSPNSSQGTNLGKRPSRPSQGVSEVQKLQQQLQEMTQQNQLLQQQLQESQLYQQQLQQQLQGQEQQMAEKMQFYRDVMSSIQEVYQTSSQDLKDNFVQFLESIFDGMFASAVIMDAALYSSLSSVFEDLQDQDVVIGVHPNQLEVVEGFFQDLSIKKWVVQGDNNLDVGGFRIESQLSQWLQSPQESVQNIISKIEMHLKT
jgi:uncharacterized membrane protein YdfJ with MMPL/SSD domain